MAKASRKAPKNPTKPKTTITIEGPRANGRPFVKKFSSTAPHVAVQSFGTLASLDLRPLAGMTKLTHVNIGCNKLTHVDLRPLRKCTRLVFFNAWDNALEAIDLAPLEACPELDELDLSQNQLAQIDLRPLASCSKLSVLRLHANCLREIDLAPLARASALQILTLQGNPLSRVDLTPLATASALQFVNVGQSVDVVAPRGLLARIELKRFEEEPAEVAPPRTYSASLADQVAARSGLLVTDEKALARAPLPIDPRWRAFLRNFRALRSAGLARGWGNDASAPRLTATEAKTWAERFAALCARIDDAGEVGVVFLPEPHGTWTWYYAFGFPRLRGKPCPRILAQPPCAPEQVAAFEKRLGAKLPKVARVYHRILGALHLHGELSMRHGVLGLAPSFLGSIDDPSRPWFGLQDWVPWGKRRPLACAALDFEPDEQWWVRGEGDQLHLVGHDPGEVQPSSEDLATLIDDWLSFVR